MTFADILSKKFPRLSEAARRMRLGLIMRVLQSWTDKKEICAHSVPTEVQNTLQQTKLDWTSWNAQAVRRLILAV